MAEALYMDTNLVAKTLGTFSTLLNAGHACEHHASESLEFQTRIAGISKAQGEKYWYRITQLKEQRTERRTPPL